MNGASLGVSRQHASTDVGRPAEASAKMQRGIERKISWIQPLDTFLLAESSRALKTLFPLVVFWDRMHFWRVCPPESFLFIRMHKTDQFLVRFAEFGMKHHQLRRFSLGLSKAQVGASDTGELHELHDRGAWGDLFGRIWKNSE